MVSAQGFYGLGLRVLGNVPVKLDEFISRGAKNKTALKPPNSKCKHVCGSKKKSTFYVPNKLITFYLHKVNRIRLITRKKQRGRERVLHCSPHFLHLVKRKFIALEVHQVLQYRMFTKRQLIYIYIEKLCITTTCSKVGWIK